jgi:hypothetical protein
VRDLTFDEVRDTVIGASVLGCGGGGELSEGLELIDRARDEGLTFRLAAMDEIEDDALLACVYAVGGMTSGDDETYAGLPRAERHPTVLALETLFEHTGGRPAGVIPGELGATSVAEAFYPAAALGLPVVDADTAGRAVPEMQHSAFFLARLPIAPQAIVNEFGETLLVKSVVDDRRSEALVRALAIASHNVVWVADHALPASRLRTATVPGTVSRALSVGQALRSAQERGEDLGAAVAAAASGRVLFAGVVAEASWRDEDGFTFGEIEIDGIRADEGSRYRIWFKNENLMAWRDGTVDVTTPDLICVLDTAQARPLTNPLAEPGMTLQVVGAPAPGVWRSAEGLAVFGPRSFGFDVEYRPLEATAG